MVTHRRSESARPGPDPERIETRRDFARELTLARELAGLTVRDVAKASGIPDGTIGDYFAGRHLPPLNPPRLPQILHACEVTDPETVGRWLDALRRVRRRPGRRTADGPVPYRGLASYQPQDAEWFFGREKLTGDLVQRLLRHPADSGMVAVVGPSGSGKSSLLRAGLVPVLRGSGPDESGPWPTVLFTPGADPIGALAAELTAAGAPDGAAADMLRGYPGRAAELARRMRSAATPETATEALPVLVIDQFEEVFTSGCTETERQAFFTALRAMTVPDGDGKPGPPSLPGPPDPLGPAALVVIGLRADFYGQALRYRELAEVLEQAQVIVGPMTAAELRKAIVAPARQAGRELEEGLVDLLLRELGPPTDEEPAEGAHEAGALPLLSHALLATWESRRQGMLTIDDYRASGGINGAVARTAEEVYAGLSPAQQRITRQIFVRLVHIADDTGDTRRRVSPQQLHLDDDAPEVLARFIDQRLITATASGVEIAHEALLLAWPRLRTWLDTDRLGLRTHRRLTVAAEAWQEAGRDPNALLRGMLFAEVAEWADEPRHTADLNLLEREFLAACVDRQVAETRSARRRVRRGRLFTAVLVALSLTASALAALAFRQQADAKLQRDQAVSRQIAVEANRLRGKDVVLAGQLSLAAYRIARTPEARSSLLESYAVPGATRVVGPAGVMQSVGLTRDGNTMATAATDHSIRLWNVADRSRPRPLGAPLTGHRDTVYSVAFSPDGTLLASGSGDHTVFLWRPTGRRPTGWRPTGAAGPTTWAVAAGHPLGTAGNTVYSVAFSPDGRTLAAGSADGTVMLWDVTDPTRPAPLGRPQTGPGGFVHSVAFSPDGHTLAAGSATGRVLLWNLADRARPEPDGEPLTGPAKAVFAVAFSPDGHTLAAGSADNTVRLWDLRGGARPPSPSGPLTGPQGWVNAVAFGPDGHTLAAASSDGRLWLWDPATHRQIGASLPHPGPVTGVVFRSARSLATSAADGVARIWDLPGPAIPWEGGDIFATTFSATGHVLAVTDADNTARLWNVSDPRRPAPLGPVIRDATRAGRASGAAMLSPDGRTLAVGGADGGTRLWDVTDPARPEPLPTRLTGPTALVQGYGFSPDGRLLAVAGNDWKVWLWDVRDPRRPVRTAPPLTGAHNYTFAPMFSPDGRTLAYGSADFTVHLWDVADPHRPTPLGPPLTEHRNYVFNAVFSPDGRVLATAGADNKVLFWDITDRRRPRALPRPLTGPSNFIWALAYDRAGKTLAAAAGDGTVWLWDVSEPHHPRMLATLNASTESVYTAAFDGDRPVLVTAGADGPGRLWNTDPDQVAAQLCSVAGTPITRAEWRRHLPAFPYDPPCEVS